MRKSEKILIVDDEKGILDLLEITLKKERYDHISRSMNGQNALDLIKHYTYDLILLDVMLPDFNGFDLCNEIRKHTNTPIIFITSCSSDFDKLTGLGIGGDDYITKPFNPLEVVARVKALLRRKNMYELSIDKDTEVVNNTEYNYGRFQLIPNDALLIVNDNKVECTAKELELLKFFCKNPNRIFTTSQIYQHVWGEDVLGEEKTVTIHISKIRRKLGDNPRNPEMIVNLRGIGYKFVPPSTVNM
ncbi:response regulator transcription factor [Bacillus solimangrovi]|uniref:DNA-binding response regulator n=1 Tax=Bacillus solimangrovi TaxID=1305675 RepID=A0A1E5LK36_9BACI|nr:response regulator transcription factor [Bacillus solimangrovi]OEH94431.1 DNA-binding response regulator [Bacillus solimangrovi]